jgi:hypothetical protein
MQDGILSIDFSLPFTQDVLADKKTADTTKKGKQKGPTAPKMCFQLSRAR